MTNYELITVAVEKLKINKNLLLNVRDIVESKVDNCIYLTCDTDDGKASSVTPYLVFKAIIPFDDLSSLPQSIDGVANIHQGMPAADKILLRIAYRIFRAYRDAIKQIAKN